MSIESSLVCKTKTISPEECQIYIFVEDTLDWYEVELEVKKSDLNQELKQTILEYVKSFSTLNFPFELFETIVIRKYGLNLLLIETQHRNKKCVIFDIDKHQSRNKFFTVLLFSLLAFAIWSYTINRFSCFLW